MEKRYFALICARCNCNDTCLHFPQDILRVREKETNVI